MIKSGDYVAWKWAGGIAHGKVLEIHHDRTHIESKGKIITRNGTDENPAIIIKHHKGSLVLKLFSEIYRSIESN